MNHPEALLLTLAGTGLVLPIPASAADLNRYSPALNDDPLPAMARFTDLRPGNWAHQALADLIERHGCLAGHPDGGVRGWQTLSRQEAAALLNACLARVTEVTDALRQLLVEFEPELALLRVRGERLTARLAALEAGRFAGTTRLSGLATTVVGGVSHNPAGERITVNTDLQLNLDTSFGGRDLLRTVLRGGNFDGIRNAFNQGLSTLETAFQEDSGADVIGIYRLYYQFPIGRQFTATIGGMVGQEDMLALWPSAYPGSTVLNLFNLGGAPLANNQTMGPGLGLWWQHQGWSVSTGYVAANGGDASRGLFTSRSAGAGTVQLGYGRKTWGLATTYSHIDGGVAVPGATALITRRIEDDGVRTHAFGISGFWQPAESGWLPSISGGYGLNRSSREDLRTSQSWMVGLEWNDVGTTGLSFGTGVGQPAFATRHGADREREAWAWEGWIAWQVTDRIRLTPAVFYLRNPAGGNSDRDQFGALLKTSFSF
jgi:hypothetical protein